MKILKSILVGTITTSLLCVVILGLYYLITASTVATFFSIMFIGASMFFAAIDYDSN